MGGLEPPTQRPRVRAANNFGTNMPGGYVYILASKRNGTLYIGITCNLVARVIAHREGRGSSFVKKYDVTRLVLYEYYPLYMDAMRRETSLKRWKRKWKLELIEKHNPHWEDLTEKGPP